MSDFADRMKQYESHETHRWLIPFLPVYIRLDGRAFTTFTRDMDKPYDERMAEAMLETTKSLVQETDALIGYTQSDEINLVMFSENRASQGYFEGKRFKITSVLAGIASSVFLLNYIKTFEMVTKRSTLIGGIYRTSDELCIMPPAFDCRVLNMPSQTETANMILWRELDATRNAIISAARTVYSQEEIYQKNFSQLQEMMFEKGINFNDYPASFKRGTFVRRVEVMREIEQTRWDEIPEAHKPSSRSVQRSEVITIEMPPFSKVTNREAVIFEGALPIVKGSTQ